MTAAIRRGVACRKDAGFAGAIDVPGGISALGTAALHLQPASALENNLNPPESLNIK